MVNFIKSVFLLSFFLTQSLILVAYGEGIKAPIALNLNSAITHKYCSKRLIEHIDKLPKTETHLHVEALHAKIDGPPINTLDSFIKYFSGKLLRTLKVGSLSTNYGSLKVNLKKYITDNDLHYVEAFVAPSTVINGNISFKNIEDLIAEFKERQKRFNEIFNSLKGDKQSYSIIVDVSRSTGCFFFEHGPNVGAALQSICETNKLFLINAWLNLFNLVVFLNPSNEGKVDAILKKNANQFLALSNFISKVPAKEQELSDPKVLNEFKFTDPIIAEDDKLLAASAEVNISGIGLGGLENSNTSISFFERLFTQAKGLGLYVVAHSGEVTNGVELGKAFFNGNISRIGHGASWAAGVNNDHAFIESCPSSNVILQACFGSRNSGGACTVNLASKIEFSDYTTAMKTHPIHQMLDKGVKVTLNTDDPEILSLTGASLHGGVAHNGDQKNTFNAPSETEKGAYKFSEHLFLNDEFRNFIYFNVHPNIDPSITQPVLTQIENHYILQLLNNGIESLSSGAPKSTIFTSLDNALKEYGCAKTETSATNPAPAAHAPAAPPKHP